MKPTFWLACLPAVCLCLLSGPICAREVSWERDATAGTADGGSSNSSTHITGTVKDPTGAVVPDARVEISERISGFTATNTTDHLGRFNFDGIAAGRYELRATAAGFAMEVVPALVVVDSGDVVVNLWLHIASARTSIEVKAPLLGSASATMVEPGLRNQAPTAGTTELLAETPGVTLRENGSLGAVPVLHGLGDERTRLVVDGMTVSWACPNHMNPPSSYMSPSHTARMTVMPGITPVSVGGDSLGGTIAIESTEPEFAEKDQRVRQVVNSSGFYRSNGQNYGGSFSEWTAWRHLAFGYNGSWATNDNYEDGNGHEVTSTYAQTTDHTLTLAARDNRNFVAIRAGLHYVPYEGFPNAQMDMVRDYAESLNLHYRRSFEHGALDTHAYWQGTWHSMNVGKDKSTFPMPMFMPMNTHGRDIGYSWKFDLPIAARHNLAAGNELHRFRLDDSWPPVPGTGMMPDTFLNINNGRRTRLGWFAELTSDWSPQWTTLFGLRTDTVWMNTDAVHGYSMMYARDANTFNAARRDRHDNDVEATGWTRYQPNAHSTFEFGYARKSRVPNLYERYAWSTSRMISGMIGWFGDGNYYVGSLALGPEAADTLGGTATWHDAARANWDITATPYVTWVHDYVDVDTITTFKYPRTTLAQLRFANHEARIAGVDLSGNRTVWQNDRFGLGRLTALGAWQQGKRTDSSTSLYQMMPVHAHIGFDEQKSGFTGGLGVDVADRKSDADPNRFEIRTPGYALFELHAGYQHGHFRASSGTDNLLNRYYELPLGGVNVDDFLSSGRTSQLRPLTGRGRSVYFALGAQF